MDKYYELLKIINEVDGITQRNIAKEVDISVGKVNSTIKSMISDGIITVEFVGRKPYYRVTEKGLKELEQKITENKMEKINLYKEIKKVNQAVILAAGYAEEFSVPVGLLDLENSSIIERSISMLRAQGIEDIIIVAGYKKELYEELCKKYGLTCVINDKYKWTGTMHSLACAEKYIKGDFLLLESDMIFEDRALRYIINKSDRDCILITAESGSGDEAFVEIREGSVFKMTKDIHQLNKIDGEMIGITKISYEVFKRMMDQFQYNRNPYLNYEYSLLDVGRIINIGYVKVDDLVWTEIDHKKHYENLVNYVYPRLKRKELEYKTQKLKEMLVNSAGFNEEDITEIIPAGGMTNKNYKATIDGDEYILRVPGFGTEDMISRRDEKFSAEIANKLELDTPLIYFNEETGIKVSKFISNSETLNGTSAKREENMRLVTDILKKLHNSDVVMNNRFDVFEKIQHYEELLKKAGGYNFPDYNEVKEKVMNLENILEEIGYEIKPSHNDTVPENFIKGPDDRLYLIDWEYGGMNDPMWDLAAHSIECNFSPKDEELFFRLYFGGEPNDNKKKRILIYKICQDFLWSIWTNIKEAKGDDFGSYGPDRYNRAKENLIKIYEGVK